MTDRGGENRWRNRIKHLEMLVAEYRLDGIRLRLGGRLTVEQFVAHIGVDKVLRRDGRIDGMALELAVADLLRRDPTLCDSRSDVTPSAVESQ